MKKKEWESVKINIYYHLEESKSCKHSTFIICVPIDLQKHYIKTEILELWILEVLLRLLSIHNNSTNEDTWP